MSVLCKHAKQIKKHYIENGGKGDLAKELQRNGVSKVEAERVAKLTGERFKRIAKDDVGKLYAGLMKNPVVKQNSKKFQNLIVDTIEGRASAAQIENQVSEAFGLPGISKDKAARITGLANEIRALKSNPALNKNKIIEKTAKLEQEIAETTPSEFLRKADTFTTANLLLNPKTILRNVISNEMELLGKQIQGVIQGKWKASDAKLLSEIRQSSWKQMQNDIAKGIRTTNLQGSELYGAGMARTFRPEELKESKNIIAKGFEKLGAFQEKGLRHALETHDVIARNMAFAQSTMEGLRDIPALKNIEFKSQKDFDKFLDDLENGKVKGVSKEQWQDIKHYAEWESTKTVLQDDSALGRVATAIGRLGENALNDKPFAQAMFKFSLGTILKFAKTPSNIVMRILERDLLTGTALTAARWISGKDSGIKTDYFLKRQALAGFTNALAGTFGIGGAGYIMSAMGILEPEGYQDSQVLKIGDTTFNVAPFAIFLPQLSFGAELQQKLETEKSVKSVFDAYGKNWNNLIAALLDSPVMTGPKKLVEAVEDYSKGPDEQKGKLAELVVNGGTQWIPFISMLRGVAKGIDDKERDTYSKDGLEKSIKYAASNIPGLRQMLPEKIDTAGRPVKPISDNMAVRLVDSLINPAVTKTSPNADPVFEELRRLNKEGVRGKGQFAYAPNSFKSNGEKYTLNDKQKREYTIEFGKQSYDAIDRLIKSPSYQRLDAEAKQDKIAAIEKAARAKAKNQLLFDLRKKEKVGV